MATANRLRYLHAQLAWMLGVVLLLASTETLTLPLFAVGSVVGLLAITALTAPRRVKPAWRRRLRWVLVLALALFVYLLARRVQQVLGGVPFA